MSNSKILYCQKLTSCAEAMHLVHDGDSIIVPTRAGEPPALLTVLSEQRRSFQDIKVR